MKLSCLPTSHPQFPPWSLLTTISLCHDSLQLFLLRSFVGLCLVLGVFSQSTMLGSLFHETESRNSLSVSTVKVREGTPRLLFPLSTGCSYANRLALDQCQLVILGSWFLELFGFLSMCVQKGGKCRNCQLPKQNSLRLVSTAGEPDVAWQLSGVVSAS